MHSPAEICYLEGVLQTNEDVLWLDVSMDDVLCVAVLNGLHHLFEIPSGPSLRKLTSALQKTIKLSSWSHLKHEVHSLLVMKETVKPENVHMPAMRLNFNLPSQLMLHTVLDELRLIQHLQSENETCAALSCDIHSSKL